MTLFLNIDKLREFSSYMIENAVKDNSYVIGVKFITDVLERIVVTKSAVYHFVVCRIVTVLNGLKNRAEVNGVNIHFLEVRYPLKNLVKTVNDLAAVIELGRSAESERVDVINNGIIVPADSSNLLCVRCIVF